MRPKISASRLENITLLPNAYYTAKEHTIQTRAFSSRLTAAICPNETAFGVTSPPSRTYPS
jgi:hypothetical protein